MLIVFGELLLCGFVLMGCLLLGKTYPKVAEGMFLIYGAFILLNYFVVRWRHEWLKKKVVKFAKMRKKVSNFDFGMPHAMPPKATSSSTSAAPKKPK